MSFLGVCVSRCDLCILGLEGPSRNSSLSVSSLRAGTPPSSVVRARESSRLFASPSRGCRSISEERRHVSVFHEGSWRGGGDPGPGPAQALPTAAGDGLPHAAPSLPRHQPCSFHPPQPPLHFLSAPSSQAREWKARGASGGRQGWAPPEAMASAGLLDWPALQVRLFLGGGGEEGTRCDFSATFN